MNKFFGLSCILLSFSLLSGCVTEKIVYENGREVVKTDDDDSPERSKLAADNRVKIAIRLLNEGQADAIVNFVTDKSSVSCKVPAKAIQSVLWTD